MESELIYFMPVPMDLFVDEMTYKDKLVLLRIYSFWFKKKQEFPVDIDCLANQLKMSHTEFCKALKHLAELNVISVKIIGVPKKWRVNIFQSDEKGNIAKKAILPKKQYCEKSNITKKDGLILPKKQDQSSEKGKINLAKKDGLYISKEYSKEISKELSKDYGANSANLPPNNSESISPKNNESESGSQSQQESAPSFALTSQIETTETDSGSAKALALKDKKKSKDLIKPTAQEIHAFLEHYVNTQRNKYPDLIYVDLDRATDDFIGRCEKDEWKTQERINQWHAFAPVWLRKRMDYTMKGYFPKRALTADEEQREYERRNGLLDIPVNQSPVNDDTGSGRVFDSDGKEVLQATGTEVQTVNSQFDLDTWVKEHDQWSKL